LGKTIRHKDTVIFWEKQKKYFFGNLFLEIQKRKLPLQLQKNQFFNIKIFINS